MNGLIGFVTAFCSVCIILGGLSLLIPSGKFEGPIKYIFGLIFILCIISAFLPLKKINTDLEIFKSQTEINNLNEKSAEMNLRLALLNSNINFSKITVCTDKLSDGSITINKVIVFSRHSPESIRAALGGKGAQYDIEVIYE